METKNWTVYEHICPNGKRYIGITCQKPENRWNNGRGYEKGTAFRRAIDKYGWNDIQHNILFNDLTEKEAKWLENYLICYYWTFVGFNDSKGYNMTLGGEGTVGWKPSEEQKKKMGETNKGKTPWLGKHHTEESRKKISESKKGTAPWNKGLVGKQNAWNKGKKIFCGESNPMYGTISPNRGKHRVYREDGTYFYN